jgi:hypothetical protein
VLRQKLVSRLAVAVGALAFASLASLPFAAGPFGQTCAEAATGPSVALVVDFGNVSGQGNPPGGVVTRCVSHSNDMTGAQALIDAGFKLRIEDGLLCAISGYPATGCGEKTGARKYLYWSYWKAPAGTSTWEYSGAGVGVEIRAGVAEGWRFVEGSGSPNDLQPGAAPDHLAICGPIQPDIPSNSGPNEPDGRPAPTPDNAVGASGAIDGGSGPPSTDPTGPNGADVPADVATTAKNTAATGGNANEDGEAVALDDAAPAAETSSTGGVGVVVVVVLLIAALGGAAVVRSKRQPRAR